MAEGAAIGAGGGLLGSFIGMGVQQHNLNQNWSRTKRILQEGIRWKVNDLRAAGLNPILAAGGGFSGPSGAAPLGPPMDLGKNIAPGIAAGVSKTKAKSEISANEANAEAGRAAAERQRAGVNTEISQQLKNEADANMAYANAEQVQAQTAITLLQQPGAQALSELYTNPYTREAMKMKLMLEGVNFGFGGVSRGRQTAPSPGRRPWTGDRKGPKTGPLDGPLHRPKGDARRKMGKGGR